MRDDVNLDVLVTVLRPRLRNVRLATPVVIDGRAFVQEQRSEYLPLHRKLPAAFVTTSHLLVRDVRDVTTDDRVQIGEQRYPIVSITRSAGRKLMSVHLGATISEEGDG